MSTESNKTVVRRYFEEALDQRNLDALDEIVTAGEVLAVNELNVLFKLPSRGMNQTRQPSKDINICARVVE